MESAPGTSPVASEDHSTPRPPVSDMGRFLFEQANALNAAAIEHIKIGRRQMAADVSGIISTLSARKEPLAVINQIITLLRKEVP